MRRVQVSHVGKVTDAQLVERLRPYERFLCIVNTRPHAARLFQQLAQGLPADDPASLIHLSTRMCGQHRSQVIARIRERLRVGKPCRVISTQLVEAGVDLDFPVVFRALAGIDAIAQAAGRCNREGRNSTCAVFVFDPLEVRLHGFLGSTAQSTAELLPEVTDLLGLDAVRRYFELHYWKHEEQLDAKGILPLFQSPSRAVFQFRSAARLFQMIEDPSRPVVIPWESEGQALVEELTRPEPPDWRIKRKLQRFMVPVYTPAFHALFGAGDVTMFHDCFVVLTNPARYDERLGLRLEEGEPEALLVSN
jgi:CRISPR-associated endonuclease/helicase Cas3